MSSILVCAHPWKLIQATQQIWNSDPPETLPAIYLCPICQKTKSEGDPDPRIVLGRIEEDAC